MNATSITNTADGLFFVIFGFQQGGEFRVSYGKPSRHYKTRKGAERAAAKWEAA